MPILADYGVKRPKEQLMPRMLLQLMTVMLVTMCMVHPTSGQVSGGCSDFVDVVIDVPKGIVTYDADSKDRLHIVVQRRVGTTIFIATSSLQLKEGTVWARHLTGLILRDREKKIKEIGPFDGWRDLNKVLVFVEGTEKYAKLTRKDEWVGLVMDLPWTYSTEEVDIREESTQSLIVGRIGNRSFGFDEEIRERRWLTSTRRNQPPTGYAWRLPAILKPILPPDKEIVEAVLGSCPYTFLVRDSPNPPVNAIK